MCVCVPGGLIISSKPTNKKKRLCGGGVICLRLMQYEANVDLIGFKGIVCDCSSFVTCSLPKRLENRSCSKRDLGSRDSLTVSRLNPENLLHGPSSGRALGTDKVAGAISKAECGTLRSFRFCCCCCFCVCFSTKPTKQRHGEELALLFAKLRYTSNQLILRCLG